MKSTQALKILIAYQQWRLGLLEDMPCTPSELTQAINVIINHHKYANRRKKP